MRFAVAADAQSHCTHLFLETSPLLSPKSLHFRSVGRITIELFWNDAPKTCENFHALCVGDRGVDRGGKRLHYRGSKMHRIIRGFMAQGGDFTHGNGYGGSSIYGSTFEDENFLHRHDERGLLSMANSGPNTNASQFFILFGDAPHLDGKHVVFGRVREGRDLLTMLEHVAVGANNVPKMDVVIDDCGEIEEEGAAAAAAPAAAPTAAGADQEELDVEEEEKRDSEEEEEAEDDVAAAAAKRADGDSDAEDETATTAPAAAAAAKKAKDPSKMTPMERRLFDLRLKLNAGRKANQKATKEEHRRETDPREAHAERAREKEEGKRQWEADLERRGLKADEAYLLESAEHAGRSAAREAQKEKNKTSFGWDIFNRDSLFRGYEKRLGTLPPNAGGGARGSELVVPADPLLYGETSKPSEVALERMAGELRNRAERRDKFSRRRTVAESADIDYINDRNEHFNKKIKRAYDKYTVEIRQNLERGTAL
ncbi:unnamed protein product [Phaeothamnion confervicola]